MPKRYPAKLRARSVALMRPGPAPLRRIGAPTGQSRQIPLSLRQRTTRERSRMKISMLTTLEAAVGLLGTPVTYADVTPKGMKACRAASGTS